MTNPTPLYSPGALALLEQYRARIDHDVCPVCLFPELIDGTAEDRDWYCPNCDSPQGTCPRCWGYVEGWHDDRAQARCEDCGWPEEEGTDGDGECG